MLKYKYLTQVPYDAHPLKTEPVALDSDPNYQRYLQLEFARATWLIEAAQNVPTSIDTTADLAANLTATICEGICECMAYKDNTGTALTTNALRYWRTFTWRKPIPDCLDPHQTYPVGSSIGSIASYAAIYPTTIWPLQPLEIVNTLLDLVWSDLQLNRSIYPNDRLEQLATMLNFDREYITKSAAALAKYAPGQVEFIKYALDSSAVKSLGLRLLLGEVTDPLISAWSRFQIACNQNPQLAAIYNQPIDGYQKPFHLMQVGLTVGRGGGWALLFQAIYLESLVAITNLLTSTRNAELTLFANDATTVEARALISLYYAAASDAQSVLAAFGTIATSTLTAENLWIQSQRWSATLPNNYLIADLGWRLSKFVTTVL